MRDEREGAARETRICSQLAYRRIGIPWIVGLSSRRANQVWHRGWGQCTGNLEP